METVRASRDGHEFHEAWAARKALQLVMPTNELVGIAVEGLSPADQSDASNETVEIADLTLYYGGDSTFETAHSVIIIQLKYSKSAEIVPFRVSNAKKTIEKFACAFADASMRYGTNLTSEKLSFELVTNRPIFPAFNEALDGIAFGASLDGDAKEQADQFTLACKFKGLKLRKFAAHLKLVGLAGSLTENKQELSRVLADWSAAPDTMSRARLGQMKALLRDKAGLVGEGRNLVTRIDVLSALDVQSPDDLFPCPASFPEIGDVVQREQLAGVFKMVPKLARPLLIHAEGGSGKTVFLQSLSKLLEQSHKTVLFDCFGGGDYRAPEDGRHLPRRGLIHIVNMLACEGLCDPLLPNQDNVDDIVRAFRSRLVQAVATLRRATPDKQIVLLIDAIDNAAEHASEKGEPAFPRLLLESMHYKGAIDGVQLIVSCRTYRRKISKGEILCEELELKPFNLAESKQYLRDRIPSISDVEIDVAYARSEGNPRILEHLALSDRGLLDTSEVENVIRLDDLLKERIEKALFDARRQGYNETQIKAFLAGLSVLPPPIPLDEYADAHGIEISAVRSFSADLAPLLEKTRYGLMFRDEPTETFIRDAYAADPGTLRRLADNLLKKQGISVYAAAALPGLLQQLGDGKLLFALAFDPRFPSAITSTVGQQHIRYARLKAAVLHATGEHDFNSLVHLMLELSTLAAINQRGGEYFLNNPDIVTASKDVDAIRRLFEMRTRWPGTRHSRLAIANVLSGDFSNAHRHIASAEEWTKHFYGQDDEYRREKGGPETMDAACIPLFLIAQGDIEKAVAKMRRWKDWYAFEVAEVLFDLLRQAEAMDAISAKNILAFLSSLDGQPGVVAAAMCILELDAQQRQSLVTMLAHACEGMSTIEASKNYESNRQTNVHDGLLTAAAIALAIDMPSEAQKICAVIPIEVPGVWTFNHEYSNDDALAFVMRTAIRAAANGQSVTEAMLLPKELVEAGENVEVGLTGLAYRKAIKAELDQLFKSGKDEDEKERHLNYETKKNAERYVDARLDSILKVAKGFAALLSAKLGAADESFIQLIEVWRTLGKQRRQHMESVDASRTFDQLGRKILIFSLAARSDLKTATVQCFLQEFEEHKAVFASLMIEVVATIAKRPDLQELAGGSAVKAKSLIEREDDVSVRAALFAQLSRAILPASFDEMGSYFRAGIDQMDAIGSGDYQFTNALLSFASQLHGAELEDPDFHTLSNICELNMYEAEKFDWLAFGRGLAKSSGAKTLARLARWHDLGKVSLNYTLLPYLTALIDQDKIDPAIAISLLRLSDPVELYVCGTDQFAEAIAKKRFANSNQLLSELLSQFQKNHPLGLMHSTADKLYRIAENEFGPNADFSIYFGMARSVHKKLNDEGNENRNYQWEPDASHVQRLGARIDRESEERRALDAVVLECIPTDEASISLSIEKIDAIKNGGDLKRRFLESVRGKIKYGDRSSYIRIIATAEELDLYSKLHELKECRDKWLNSSAALETVFREVAIPLVQSHAEDFIHYDYLSLNQLRDLEQLTGIHIQTLALALITLFASPDWHLSASIWTSLATVICALSDEGKGQNAIKRLLNSGSAKLASAAMDGEWRSGMYPHGSEAYLAAGLVWASLGSPSAASRWHAAHSIRCFARFGKWEVIDAIFEKIHLKDAAPYQAPEITFYFLHAKLWLLIAIARVAKDYPKAVARYADVLRSIVQDAAFPHVLMRHFAAQALETCASSGSIKFSRAEASVLKKSNLSPWPKKRTKRYVSDSFYQSRPTSMPEPEYEFHLDYDFDKSSISALGNIFDRSRWETKDALAEWVHKFDPKITSMYETGGHNSGRRERFDGMQSRYHTHGQQLACHALCLVAGEFLAKYPVIIRPYDSKNPWFDWLSGETLTRDDGFWLSDGIDQVPLDSIVNLLEKGDKRLDLTSDRQKILALLKIESTIGQELVIAGDWRSLDGVSIHVTSALAPARIADKLAEKVSKEGGFQAWLPVVQIYDSGEEATNSDRSPFVPLIAASHSEARLDEADPLAANSVLSRPKFTKSINEVCELFSADPFERIWKNAAGEAIALSEAWGRNPLYDEDESSASERFVCSSNFLADILSKNNADLTILVRLRRHEKGFSEGKSEFWHTIAVLRINSTLAMQYYPGEANKLHESRF